MSAAGRIRYGVAMSLDGFIAGPQGEADWITSDPAFDFAALWAQFDTLLMGRRTYQAATARLGPAVFGSKKTVVVSRTLAALDHPNVHIVAEPTREAMGELRRQSRHDIWLMGGGVLFGALLAIDEVDTVELNVMPVLLGDGVPVVQPPALLTRLRLAQHRVFSNGMVSLEYEVQRV